jgi:hypothetical protein
VVAVDEVNKTPADTIVVDTGVGDKDSGKKTGKAKKKAVKTGCSQASRGQQCMSYQVLSC